MKARHEEHHRRLLTLEEQREVVSGLVTTAEVHSEQIGWLVKVVGGMVASILLYVLKALLDGRAAAVIHAAAVGLG